MNYEAAIELLLNNHIYPLKVEKNLRTGNIMSIQVDCAPIMKDSKIEHLKKVLGDGFSFQFFGNDHNYILVTKNH